MSVHLSFLSSLFIPDNDNNIIVCNTPMDEIVCTPKKLHMDSI